MMLSYTNCSKGEETIGSEGSVNYLIYGSSKGKNVIIEKFIETKFNATYNKDQICLKPPEKENLGIPDKVLSFQNANEMMLSFSMG